MGSFNVDDNGDLVECGKKYNKAEIILYIASQLLINNNKAHIINRLEISYNKSAFKKIKNGFGELCEVAVKVNVNNNLLDHVSHYANWIKQLDDMIKIAKKVDEKRKILLDRNQAYSELSTLLRYS